MTKRIFRSICLVAITMFAASVALVLGVLYEYFSDIQQSQLHMQTELAAQGVANEGIDYFSGLKISDYRITWIDGNGTVLYDSESDTADMENHLARKEVTEALTAGYGESRRYSATLMERSLYSALTLEDGSHKQLFISLHSY